MSTTAEVLLDTSVLINVIDSGEIPRELDGVPSAISAITLAEMEYGVATARDAATSHKRRLKLESVRRLYAVVPFESTAATHYGALAKMVSDAGRNPRPRRMDLQIASVAMASGLPLATANPRDFQDLTELLRIYWCRVSYRVQRS